MSDDIKRDQDEGNKSLDEKQVVSRRRFTKTGLGGAVAMSLFSRSALGTNSVCTPSNLASHFNGGSLDPRVELCFFACSPGYWSFMWDDNNQLKATPAHVLCSWNQALIDPGTKFRDHFGMLETDFADDDWSQWLKNATMYMVINKENCPTPPNGPFCAISFHAVAGYMNASHPFISAAYPLNVFTVTSTFRNEYQLFKLCIEQNTNPNKTVNQKASSCKAALVAWKDILDDILNDPNSSCPLPINECVPSNI